METALIIFYTLLFLLAIRTFSWFHHEKLSWKFLAIVFLLKVAMGLGYGQYFQKKDGGSSTHQIADTFDHFHASLPLVKSIYKFNEPKKFLRLVVGPRGGEPPEELDFYVQQIMMHWNSINNYTLLRYNSVLYFYSFGIYNVQVVINAFLGLLGLLALFKFVFNIAPDRSRIFRISIFLIPTVVFWTSGLHKEGLLLSLTGFYLYGLHNWLNSRKVIFIIVCLLSAGGIYLLREYLMILIVPLTIAYIWTSFSKKWMFAKFLLVHILFWTTLLNLGRVDSRLNLMERLVHRQQEFFDFQGGSDIYLPKLDSSVLSLLRNIPVGLFNTLARPHPLDIRSIPILVISIETYLLLLILVLAVVKREVVSPEKRGLLLLCFFFAAFLLMFVGSIVPNLGAIARYKSIATPFLLMGCLLLMKPLPSISRLFSTFK